MPSDDPPVCHFRGGIHMGILRNLAPRKEQRYPLNVDKDHLCPSLRCCVVLPCFPAVRRKNNTYIVFPAFCGWRDRRDLNPRTVHHRLSVFRTAPFDHLGTVPCKKHHPGKDGAFVIRYQPSFRPGTLILMG